MSRESNGNYWTRTFGRRRVLGGAATAGVGAAALLLAGCGDDDKSKNGGGGGDTTSSGTPDAAQIPRDGIAHFRQAAPVANINPYKGLDSGLLWGFTVFDHLWYTPLDTGVRENFLATSIEQQDPLHFTAKIGNATFHNKPPINGRAVKAADVKASYESAAKQTAISLSSWWTNVLDKIETPDDKTINFSMKVVDAYTFSSSNAGSPIGGSILPEEIAKSPSFMDTDLIGSGRYQFVSHQNGTNAKLKRFEEWRLKPQPYLAGIEYKLIQEQAAALAAFSAKEIDTVGFANKLERDDISSKLGKQIVVDSDTSRSVNLVQTRGDGQWKDPRVIKAISLALDKQELMTLIRFGEAQLTGPVPPAFKSQALTEKEIADTYGKFNIGQAKQLLSASGFDTSKEYQLKYITPGDNGAQYAQIVQAQLAKNLGIKIKLVGEDFGKWLAFSLYGSQYDGFITYGTLAYDDPSSYIGGYNKVIGGRPNWAGWVDDELDAAVIKQKTILDDTERNRAVHDIQLRAWEKGSPFIPTYVAITSGAAWGYYKGRITGRGSYGAFNGADYIEKH